MREKASVEILEFEAANQDLRNEKLTLDKVKAEFAKAQMKTVELQNVLSALKQEFDDTRDTIILVPIPCPVCTNPLDPDGVMPIMEKKKRHLENLSVWRLQIWMRKDGEGVPRLQLEKSTLDWRYQVT